MASFGKDPFPSEPHLKTPPFSQKLTQACHICTSHKCVCTCVAAREKERERVNPHCSWWLYVKIFLPAEMPSVCEGVNAIVSAKHFGPSKSGKVLYKYTQFTIFKEN
uniref:Uncharacterized protein n=1 Tax=Oryzias melastigma TaxID=30732 RepID=A0A3B3CDM8_ORYME